MTDRWTPGDGPQEEIDPAARSLAGLAAGSEGGTMDGRVAHLTLHRGGGPRPARPTESVRSTCERLGREDLERRLEAAIAGADRTSRELVAAREELASARFVLLAKGGRQCPRCGDWCESAEVALAHCPAFVPGPEDGPGRAA